MAIDSRPKMVAGAARMIGTRGVEATSVRELAKATGAPLGSTYHYFPGGKDQLVDEAVGWVSARVEKILEQSVEGGTVAVLDAFISNWRRLLEKSDYQSSCPVLAVATEEAKERPATPGPATRAFKSWQKMIANSLRADHVEDARADRLSWLIVASLEGAVVLARSQRDPAPLEAVAEEMRTLIEAAVA